MRYLFIILCTFLFSAKVFAGEPDPQKIVQEGKLMSQLEMASFYGTNDMFMRLPHLMMLVGGYVSYLDKDMLITTVFYNLYDTEEVIVRYKFDTYLNPVPIIIDTSNRMATPFENDLIKIRQDAVDRLYAQEDDFFEHYEDLKFNPIPLIYENERKVYLMSFTEEKIILLGNDYVLYYDDNNEFYKQEKLHSEVIKLDPENDKNSEIPFATQQTQHLHDAIQPTDVCTLMMYKKYIKWRKHYVFSQKYVSIYDIGKETLEILPIDEWKKTNKK